MDENYDRPFVLSIAGYDPSAGAGLAADLKTMEMAGAYGLGVCTALTFQDENRFIGLEWVEWANLEKQLAPLAETYPIKAVKIGLVQNLDSLEKILAYVAANFPKAFTVWDPILKASAGFEFHGDLEMAKLHALLPQIGLLTPNRPEALQLCPQASGAENAAEILSRYCPVLLKGGHSESDRAVDILFKGENRIMFESARLKGFAKHGTGCCLSSAVAARIALGDPLPDACDWAKNYVRELIGSNTGGLAYHYPQSRL